MRNVPRYKRDCIKEIPTIAIEHTHKTFRVRVRVSATATVAARARVRPLINSPIRVRARVRPLIHSPHRSHVLFVVNQLTQIFVPYFPELISLFFVREDDRF